MKAIYKWVYIPINLSSI